MAKGNTKNKTVKEQLLWQIARAIDALTKATSNAASGLAGVLVNGNKTGTEDIIFSVNTGISTEGNLIIKDADTGDTIAIFQKNIRCVR